jgi:hypothetical protein
MLWGYAMDVTMSDFGIMINTSILGYPPPPPTTIPLHALTCTPHSRTLPYTHTHTHTLERASMRGRAMLDLVPHETARTVDQTPP